MAVTALNTTTLTNAIAAGDNDFAVGSTANISVGNMLVIAGTGGAEACKVQAIPVSGRVQVLRGWTGTRARAQAASTLIYIGTPDQFRTLRDNATALVGDSGALPDYLIPGIRARDGAGNEYVLVDLTFTAFVGAGVVISKDGLFTASVITSSSAGSVGVLCEEGTSNQWAWCQVFGNCPTVQLVGGSSLVTSTGIFQPASSVSTPAVGILGRTTSQASTDPATFIFSMWPNSACTTATTSATSATGFRCGAWLNYPFLVRQPSS
jgi:hypothetical protein